MSKVKSSLINNFKALFWALIIAGIIRTFAIEPFKIPSGSMKPNLLVGDFLFVSKWDYGYSRYSFPFGLPPFKGKIFESIPERGDIIVFKLPGQENINYVKRLVGLPGETIKVVNGKIYLKTQNSTNFEVLDQLEDSSKTSFQEIVVIDSDGVGKVSFSSKANQEDYLGLIIEVDALRHSMLEVAKSLDVQIFWKNPFTFELLQCDLFVAADGSNSAARQALGIKTLQDFRRISEISEDIDDSEENESDYTQLKEFVRVGALTVYCETRTKRI